MKRHLTILCFWFAAMTTPFVVSAQELSSVLGIVSAPLANVHEEPKSKSRLATQVLMGDEVLVLEKQDNRYRISIPGQGGREGWVQQEAVQVPKDKGKSWKNGNRQWIVITSAKTEALILDKTGDHKVALYAGTRLPLSEPSTAGHDFKVRFPDRSIAIIPASEAMPEKTPDVVTNDTLPEDIAKTAQQFERVRYLAGGITSQGIDTDGLIYLCYRIHGITIGIDLATLNSRGKRVSKKELEPGDILCFYGESRGLYLGKGRFLHVPRKASAQLAGIQDRRFAHALQYGIRMIGAGPEESRRMSELSADEVLLSQARVARLAFGQRIVYWAGRFIGTPYDTDPLGLYVRSNRIVADERVDCMYHTFRSVELAASASPAEAVQKALDLRFLTRGKIADGLVTNYDERFQYGEDMVMSNKWGRNITADLGAVKTIPGSRGRDMVDVLPKHVLAGRALQKKLRDGDIVFWVKDPNKRAVGEIVAHLSIVHSNAGKAYLIHASGDKDRADRPGGGMVKEVLFSEYIRNMKFIGAFVTRFAN